MWTCTRTAVWAPRAFGTVDGTLMPIQDALLTGLATIFGVALAALVLYVAASRLLFRYGLRGETAQVLRVRTKWPARCVVVTVAALFALPLAEWDEVLTGRLEHALAILLIIAVAWLLLRGVRVVEDAAMRRFTIDMKDNLHARRKRTQALVLRRVASMVIFVVATAAVMLTFEEARAVGASLLASAGVAGLVAGIAARTTLGNLIAGLQIVFTEPIRLDDVVVVEGEWGKIEEITLTYVVVRIWDARRLVLPTTYFVEQPFQNWTRTSAQVLGAVNLHVDYTTPVEDVRQELHRILQSSGKWDRDAWVLQVIDATDKTIELRALMTAEDAPTAWDLRCEVREQLVRYLQKRHPQALPRLRWAEAELGGAEAEAHQAARAGTGHDVGDFDGRKPANPWTGARDAPADTGAGAGIEAVAETEADQRS